MCLCFAGIQNSGFNRVRVNKVKQLQRKKHPKLVTSGFRYPHRTMMQTVPFQCLLLEPWYRELLVLYKEPSAVYVQVLPYLPLSRAIFLQP
ncbi:hypothetical protein FKM82_016279 [Ascaphus truei]